MIFKTDLKNPFKRFEWEFPVMFIGWEDGDSAFIFADMGLRKAYFGNSRLAHCDTPERGKPGHLEAKIESARLIPPGTWLICKSPEMDKYGRPLLFVPFPGGGDLATHLITNGLAKPYEGGPR